MSFNNLLESIRGLKDELVEFPRPKNLPPHPEDPHASDDGVTLDPDMSEIQGQEESLVLFLFQRVLDIVNQRKDTEPGEVTSLGDLKFLFFKGALSDLKSCAFSQNFVPELLREPSAIWASSSLHRIPY